MPNINWNANDYKNGFSFVPEYGESVINLITKDKGSRVIDLGCGNGMLTDKLAERNILIIPLLKATLLISSLMKRQMLYFLMQYFTG